MSGLFFVSHGPSVFVLTGAAVSIMEKALQASRSQEQAMSKKEKKKKPISTPLVEEEKENFITMFSKLDSKQKHRIMAYLVWLLGIFIILFAYRAA